MVTSGMVSRESVENYYTNYFTMVDLAKIIDPSTFKRREFAWIKYPDPGSISDRKLFRRNARFDTPKKFLETVRTVVPWKLYMGALYCKPWSGSIIGVPWEHNELHFDIDVNDSDIIRRGGLCRCGDSNDKDERKKVCNECFEIIREATIFLQETLDEDFGLKKEDALIYFSGTRGMHVHYPEVKRLTVSEDDEKKARRALINYLTVIQEKEHVINKADDKKELVATGETYTKTSKVIGSITLASRVERLVIKWFFTKAPRDLVKKAGISPSAVDSMIEGYENGKNTREIITDLITRKLVTRRQLVKLRRNIIEYRYPRYDGTPTYDVRKVIKVPLSVDCSTGYIVTRIDDIESFQLSDVDHVDNYS